MRNVWLLFAVMLLYSCDTRQDFNANLNTAPELQVRRDDNNFNPLYAYQVTITDSLKLSQGNYYFDYLLSDDESPKDVKVSVSIIGSGILQNTAGTPSNGYIFNPLTVGFQSINLKAIDRYGLSASANINLIVFKNIPPVAVLTYLKTSVYDPLEYRIQADQSYSGDPKFGGRIINYQFSISPNYQVTTPYNFISYIFPSIGNYQVSLRVQDNDGVWSPSCVIYINVS